MEVIYLESEFAGKYPLSREYEIKKSGGIYNFEMIDRDSDSKDAIKYKYNPNSNNVKVVYPGEV